jgi:hypothetical protein
MSLLKNIVIWLVKIFKLEEVFLSEFKTLVKRRIESKIASIESVIKSVENSNGIFKEVEGVVQNIPSYLLGSHNASLIGSAKKEFNVIESGVSSLKAELEKDLKELF